MPRPVSILILALVGFVVLASPASWIAAPAQEAATETPATVDPEGPAVLERAVEPMTGDLDEMRKLRRVRVLVSFSRTNFFISEGRPYGFDCDLMTEYQNALRTQLGLSRKEMTVVFVPVPFEQLIPALLDGRGDIAAGGMTITPERQQRVTFADPYLTGVDEIIVASRSAAGLRGVDDLAGREVRIVRGSSYVGHLKRLSDDLVRRGKSPIKIVEAPEFLENEDLLEMVNAGVIELTVSDRYSAEAWREVLKDLVLRADMKINTGGQIALAVRPNNPQLLAGLNNFIRTHRKGTLKGNIIFQRYFRNTKWLINPMTPDQRARLDRLEAIFRKYGTEYGFDWLFLAAQGFQESALDQSARSSAGAEGIMQLKPSTARDVGIDRITSEDDNIHAGAKYMAWLRDTYFNDPAIAPAAKLDFTLAAYNAGPGNVKRWRELARSRGMDANLWRGNVEQISLEKVGEQTFRYVRNIAKYYVAYRESYDLMSKRDAAKESLDKSQGSK